MFRVIMLYGCPEEAEPTVKRPALLCLSYHVCLTPSSLATGSGDVPQSCVGLHIFVTTVKSVIDRTWMLQWFPDLCFFFFFLN